MGICKRHLNWTLLLGYVVTSGVYFIFALVFASMGIFDNAALLLYIVFVLAVLWLQGWYLHQKNRSLLFILFSPIILLLLTNKRALMGGLRVWDNGGNGKTINTNDTPYEIQEMLSCLTCAYFQKKDEGWCISPLAPNITKNYCSTFKFKGGKG